MRLRRVFGVSLVLWIGTVLACGSDPESAHERPRNVLFICVDDLRPELGCYGSTQVQTPHLDRLAARSLLFERAYCQAALCNPSRASVLTGLRPDSTGVFGLSEHFRERAPDVVTLPQAFKRQGFTTLALGKVFHGVYGSQDPPHPPGWLEDEDSWSAPTWAPRADYYHTAEGRRAARGWWAKWQRRSSEASQDPDGWREVAARGLATEAPDVDDEVLADGQIATRSIELLEKHRDRPFFLAVGFLKPHLPFVAPKRYWDRIDAAHLSPPASPRGPRGAPRFADDNANELRLYTDQPRGGPIDDVAARRLQTGYLACVSFVDAQIGRLLEALDRLGLRESTIVVVWGDHGFHLGDNGTWAKKTNFEVATRSPLLISAPGLPAGRTTALVELVDLYPTLMDLCGLDPPSHLEGESLLPLFREPDRAWKSAAFSQQNRPVIDDGTNLMGRSIRTDRYRYTEWERLGEVLARELYDYEVDPGETVNRIGLASEAERVADLRAQLVSGWKAARPVQ